ncbi:MULTISPECIES: cation:proton antiporter [Ramlibacter]|uniref:Cation:proton antiporter n=1 Tax=Ramlibacter aquaticus TaxID=2780094 RepID=A0ABR9SEQ0_9BURK|nr:MULTISPECIES: cation:proton antiporter [Ramlibacter]MBE7940827.1 cation:proton antiporter [Ramlibacter aquaticus]
MQEALWALVTGGLMLLMALGATVLTRIPLSTSMVYLGVGVALSPWGLGLLRADVAQHTVLVERLCEVVLLVSLFSSGLKMSTALRDRRWVLPLRLALLSMLVTVALIALAGHLLLGLSWGASVLLGGMLAPTDPVLASDVQVTHPRDRDSLRFALTAEGGLNDGTAFPFVLLGLGLLGADPDAHDGWRWLLLDGLWSSLAGLALGAGLGLAIARLVLYLRRRHREAVGLDDFLGMGLIALSYGVALLLHANGFLAVFAAGVAIRYLQRTQSPDPGSLRLAESAEADPDESVAQKVAVDPRHAPAYMAQAVLGFNEQLERIGELAVVVLIGALLWSVQWQGWAWWFVPLLLLGVRPVAVALGLRGSRASRAQRWLMGWFGIRGVGSLYYLAYAANHGLPHADAVLLASVTLSVVVSSIVLHGISVTPLMQAYEKRKRRGR